MLAAIAVKEWVFRELIGCVLAGRGWSDNHDIALAMVFWNVNGNSREDQQSADCFPKKKGTTWG